MEYIIQGLSYVSFGALCLFGLLSYFKDHKMYPMYPIGLKLSIIASILLVSLQIYLALPNLVGLLIWLFLMCLVAIIYFIIQMIVAKTQEKKLKNRNFAFIAMFFAIGTIVILMVVLAQMNRALK